MAGKGPMSSSKRRDTQGTDSSDEDEADLRSFYGKGAGSDPHRPADSSSSSSGSDGDGDSGDDESGEESGSDGSSSNDASDAESDGSEEASDDDEDLRSIASESSARPLSSFTAPQQVKKATSTSSAFNQPSPNLAAVSSSAAATKQAQALAPIRRVAKKASSAAPVPSSSNDDQLLLLPQSEPSLLDTSAFPSQPQDSLLLSFSADSPPSLSATSSTSSFPTKADTVNSIDQLFAQASLAPQSAAGPPFAASSAISSMELDIYPNAAMQQSNSMLNAHGSALPLVPYGQGPLSQLAAYPPQPLVPSGPMGAQFPQPMMSVPFPSGSGPLPSAPAAGRAAGPPVEERLSTARVILKPELCGGLGLLLFHRFSAKPAAFADAAPVLLVLKNHSDHMIRFTIFEQLTVQFHFTLRF